MSDRFREIADRYTPAFIRVRYKRKRDGKLVLTPAHASVNPPEVLIPRPETIEALAVALHEFARLHLRHFHPEETDNLTLRRLYTGGQTDDLSLQEYEAEAWTVSTLRREGVAVPSVVIDSMRAYVSDCISEGGVMPRRRVAAFARSNAAKKRRERNAASAALTERLICIFWSHALGTDSAINAGPASTNQVSSGARETLQKEKKITKCGRGSTLTSTRDMQKNIEKKTRKKSRLVCGLGAARTPATHLLTSGKTSLGGTARLTRAPFSLSLVAVRYAALTARTRLAASSTGITATQRERLVGFCA